MICQGHNLDLTVVLVYVIGICVGGNQVTMKQMWGGIVPLMRKAVIPPAAFTILQCHTVGLSQWMMEIDNQGTQGTVWFPANRWLGFSSQYG